MKALLDEGRLIRAALDLGAAGIGGPLSKSELRLAEKAQVLSKTPAPLLSELRDALIAGCDPLGETFAMLRSPLERRCSGAFYTPSSIVTPMVRWILDRAPGRVVDPGCGSGRFIQAVAIADPKVETIAIDLDPLATLMTRAMLRALKARRATVVHADYTRFRLARFAGKTAFIGNPPYVRHHALDRAAKERAAQLATRLGHRLSKLAGLHAHFFLSTASIAAAGDVGCFVTSAEWLDVNYGSIVRGLMLDGLGGSGVHLIAPDAVTFEEAMTTAALAYFEVGNRPEQLIFSVSREPRLPGGLGGNGHPVARIELESAKRWSPLMNRRQRSPESAVPLGSIVRVSRGQVTGANAFFVMSRERARALGIERWCRPAITSAREILRSDGVVRDRPERLVVLDLPAEVDRRKHRRLDDYLRTGETAGGERGAICERYVARARSAWWAIKPQTPPIVASYMARQAPRFALNPDGLATINVVHGLWPRVPMSAARLRALVAYLNDARESFVGMGRTYHGGLEKFEPREMEALPVSPGFSS